LAETLPLLCVLCSRLIILLYKALLLTIAKRLTANNFSSEHL
jgi:hypothetical protein